MKGIKWWTAAIIAGIVGVGAVTTVAVRQAGVAQQLDHGTPLTITAPEPLRAVSNTDQVPAEQVAQLAALATDPALGELGAKITVPATGQVLLAAGEDTPLRPASVTKLLTATAVLLGVDENHELVTTVVSGPAPGQITLKGAGDVWLTPAQIRQLGEQVSAALGAGTVTSVQVDTSLWPGDAFNPAWDRADIGGGFIAPMEPAMVAGARLGGLTGDLPRSTNPAFDVGTALAQAVGGAPTVSVTKEAVAGDLPVVAQVSSAPLRERLHEALLESDNVAAEALGRELVVAQGKTADPVGVTATILEQLQRAGIDTTGVELLDASGMAGANRIPARVIEQVIALALTKPETRALLDDLPVAGATGTLSERYDADASGGYVRAKTGTLTGTNALGGYVVSQSGKLISFGLISNGSETGAGREALDRLASFLYTL